ncbi:hypothetical protein [Leadbetterella sp. DM7]|uniref:hypothetical protein n=1 Tax=Leadbetterella sp. DM7 TaxID=3235085 RepID=UPI00349EE092
MKYSEKKTEYLTKRLVARQSKIAFREKAQNAMLLVGHTIVVENGWVVKKSKDGREIRVREINNTTPHKRKLVLD